MKFLITILGFFFLLVFQNCSDIAVEKVVENSVLTSQVKPAQSICAPMGASFSAPLRFVFVIDMSMSNVGTLISNVNNTTTTYYIDKSDGPSDLNGQRFSYVKNFISECGNIRNAKYSIMGFSKESILVNDNSCLSAFEDNTSALQTLDAMKSLQDHDLKISSLQQQNTYYLQGETYYSKGLQCVRSKINEELNLLTDQKPIYHVFFITDGMTTDPLANQNYQQVLSEIQQKTAMMAGGFNFYPVYYTAKGAKNQGRQQDQALTALNAMAKFVNPNQRALLLEDLGTGSNEFCKILKPDLKIGYELKKFYALNLNALPQQKELLPDSDADGLSDQLEIEIGFDPLDPRSSGIQDSLCFKMGMGVSQCQVELSKLKCDSKKFKLGLNDCDLQISSKIFGVNLNGIDLDLDFIPDFIELLRSSNPAISDNLDTPFGDGVSNFSKIEKGIDILANLNILSIPSDQKIEIQFSEDEDLCLETNSKKYSYVIDRMPLQNVKSYSDKNIGFYDLGHGEDENNILLVSYWQPLGGQSLPEKVYTQLLKLKINSSVYQATELKFLGDFK